MKSNFFIATLFCVFAGIAHAQFLDKNYYLVDSLVADEISQGDRLFLDSMIRNIRLAKADTTKIKLLGDLVENSQDDGIWTKYNRLLNRTAKAKLKELKDTTGRTYYLYRSAEALSINDFGYYFFNYTTRYDLALKYYLESMVINEQVKNYQALVPNYSNIGNIFQNRGDLHKALIYFQKALALEGKDVESRVFLAPLNNIAQVYFYLGDTAKSIETLKRAFRISQKTNDNIIKGSLLHNIGSLAFYQNDPTGKQTLLKALALRKEIGDKKGILQTSLMLSGIEIRNKNLALSKKYLDDAAQLVVNFPESNVEALYCLHLGQYYSEIKKTELAISSLEKSVRFFEKNDDKADLQKALLSLHEMYATNPAKYAIRAMKVYELEKAIGVSLDKTKAQKLLLKQKYEEDIKVNEAKFKLEQQLRDQKNKADKQQQQMVLLMVSLVLFVLVVILIIIFRALKLNKAKNKIISDQKAEVEKQKILIEEKHKDITDSITYAHRIQSSLIPTSEQIQRQYAEVEILFKPKDIVSGDFYWYAKNGNRHMLALADCTGHGVPGAFMSIIGINCLNTLVEEKRMVRPDEMLNDLKKGIVKSLNSDASQSDKKDGMDMALISFDNRHLSFSGANQSVHILRNGDLIQLRGDKQAVGLTEKDEKFSVYEYELMPGDRIVMYSDGIVDQFGGENGKKLKAKVFKSWLTDTFRLPLAQQIREIEARLLEYMKGFEQTDDITLVIIGV